MDGDCRRANGPWFARMKFWSNGTRLTRMGLGRRRWVNGRMKGTGETATFGEWEHPAKALRLKAIRPSADFTTVQSWHYKIKSYNLMLACMGKDILELGFPDVTLDVTSQLQHMGQLLMLDQTKRSWAKVIVLWTQSLLVGQVKEMGRRDCWAELLGQFNGPGPNEMSRAKLNDVSPNDQFILGLADGKKIRSNGWRLQKGEWTMVCPNEVLVEWDKVNTNGSRSKEMGPANEDSRMKPVSRLQPIEWLANETHSRLDRRIKGTGETATFGEWEHPAKALRLKAIRPSAG
ncbi:hypothetical protein E3N88_32331 [Mikania micrantha]|uniref:Uncharacterized protein n=1 Tax=Mikania micrantha TaxID=192012 RepID=A0A5N6M8Q9_9ASTR|nr:hypothetical protein E3N88_32331 [Mikania micrantha]